MVAHTVPGALLIPEPTDTGCSLVGEFVHLHVGVELYELKRLCLAAEIPAAAERFRGWPLAGILLRLNSLNSGSLPRCPPSHDACWDAAIHDLEPQRQRARQYSQVVGTRR